MKRTVRMCIAVALLSIACVAQTFGQEKSALDPQLAKLMKAQFDLTDSLGAINSAKVIGMGRIEADRPAYARVQRIVREDGVRGVRVEFRAPPKQAPRAEQEKAELAPEKPVEQNSGSENATDGQ